MTRSVITSNNYSNNTAYRSDDDLLMHAMFHETYNIEKVNGVVSGLQLAHMHEQLHGVYICMVAYKNIKNELCRHAVVFVNKESFHMKQQHLSYVHVSVWIQSYNTIDSE